MKMSKHNDVLVPAFQILQSDTPAKWIIDRMLKKIKI